MEEADNLYYEKSLAPVRTPVTSWILWITIAVFVLQLAFYQARRVDLAQYLGLHPSAVFGWFRLVGGFLRPRPAESFLDMVDPATPGPASWVAYFPFYQFVTYVFLHSFGIFHIIFNMLALYWFGRDLEVFFGRRKYLMLYFGAAVFAGACYCLSQYFKPMSRPVIGASGAIMALVICYAVLYPNRVIILIIFPMRMKYFALLIVGVDLFDTLFRSEYGVANVAHLGGALFGFAFLKLSPSVSAFLERYARMRAARRSAPSREALDRILAKISREGIGSLSDSEKKLLREASRYYRDRQV